MTTFTTDNPIPCNANCGRYATRLVMLDFESDEEPYCHICARKARPVSDERLPVEYSLIWKMRIGEPDEVLLGGRLR